MEVARHAEGGKNLSERGAVHSLWDTAKRSAGREGRGPASCVMTWRSCRIGLEGGDLLTGCL